MTIKCNACMKTFSEDEIVQFGDMEACPMCGRIGWMAYEGEEIGNMLKSDKVGDA
jgi:phage FluMu protein Com